jgi:hypothetical protein
MWDRPKFRFEIRQRSYAAAGACDTRPSQKAREGRATHFVAGAREIKKPGPGAAELMVLYVTSEHEGWVRGAQLCKTSNWGSLSYYGAGKDGSVPHRP